MKTLTFTLASLLLLLLRSAQGTVIYDTTNSVTLQFSQPWVSVAPNTVPSTNTNPYVGPGIGRQVARGAGEYTAYSSEASFAEGTTFTQMNRAWGSAGNATLDQSGDSFALSDTYNLFTFDFGLTPTDFTISVLEWAYRFGFTADRPPDHNPSGEYLTSGSVGYQLIMDDGNSPATGYSANVYEFDNLTGIHTVRFGTFAETGVAAVYPFQVPETGSTLALLFISLSSLALLKFNGHRATRMGARAGG